MANENACEMTFDGPMCGKTASQGLGVVDSVHERVYCVLLSCHDCACRMMQSSLQFRVLDLDFAYKLRTKLTI